MVIFPDEVSQKACSSYTLCAMQGGYLQLAHGCLGRGLSGALHKAKACAEGLWLRLAGSILCRLALHLSLLQEHRHCQHARMQGFCRAHAVCQGKGKACAGSDGVGGECQFRRQVRHGGWTDMTSQQDKH